MKDQSLSPSLAEPQGFRWDPEKSAHILNLNPSDFACGSALADATARGQCDYILGCVS